MEVAEKKEIFFIAEVCDGPRHVRGKASAGDAWPAPLGRWRGQQAS